MSRGWRGWKPRISLGNDLVWLGDPANRGRSGDRRLLHRILTPAERLLVQVTPEPDRMLWSLWAAKEAAYKAWVRLDPTLVFSPSSFEVILDPVSAGATLRRPGHPEALVVRWSQGPDWVHAVAASGNLRVSAVVRPLSGNESAAVRSLALQALTEAGYPAGTIDGRPPVYRWEGDETPLSLSHDGPYGAVAFPSRP